MCPLSSPTRPVSNGETSWEAGDPTAAVTGENSYQDIISLADSVPLEFVLRHYGIAINPHANITCPFKSHKGGRESTGSFRFYPDRNAYKCYGCGSYGHTCSFVAIMDKCGRHTAATKILRLFGSDADPDKIPDNINSPERLEIMMDFSNTVRDFRRAYTDAKSQEFIEFVCRVYDRHNLKHKSLDNEALRRLVETIKEKITLHTPQ